ncbi:MAG: hypothetical protein JSR17_10885 [Proteobacteria bacterium]|nr:hypothetical protein [Pseudomonadota bacterium]
MSLEHTKATVEISETELYNLAISQGEVNNKNEFINEALIGLSQVPAYEQGSFDSDLTVLAKGKAEDFDNQKHPTDILNDQTESPTGEVKEESKGAQEQKPSENENAQATQAPVESPEKTEHLNLDDVSIVASLSETLKVLLLGGHTADLIYNDNGLPYIVQSVPRDLGIAHEFSPFIPVYIPVVAPPIQNAEPCCVDPINIGVTAGTSSFTSESITDISNILNSAFKFTFEYFCDQNLAEIVFQQVGGGVSGEGDYVTQLPDFTPETFVIKIIQDGDCPPVNCSNPIESVSVNIQSGFIFIPCIDYFLHSMTSYSGADITFLDSNGHEWALASTKEKGFELVCADIFYEGTAPIVLDLNSSGIDLISVKNSSVILNIDGKEEHTGWVGPQDGILTYGYDGHEPIQTNNFILTENVKGTQTDLQALQILAGQKGGILDMSNPIWDKLGVWQDANQNGKVDAGEYHTLNQLHIASINLDPHASMTYVNGNLVANNMSFTYTNGEVAKAADVILKTEDVIQNNQSIPEVNSSPSTTSTTTTVQPVVAETTPVAAPHVDPTVQSALEQPHAAAV